MGEGGGGCIYVVVVPGRGGWRCGIAVTAIFYQLRWYPVLGEEYIYTSEWRRVRCLKRGGVWYWGKENQG